MIIKDRRTIEQKHNLNRFVIGYDPWMSGWGEAEGMKSYAVWACSEDDLSTVEHWVRTVKSADLLNIRVLDSLAALPQGDVHISIYPVTENHVALEAK